METAHRRAMLRGSRRFMFAAIETQLRVAKGGVHECTVMRSGRIGVDVGSKMSTGHAKPLGLNGPGFLKVSDRDRQSTQQPSLIPFIALREGINQLRRNVVAHRSQAPPVAGQMRETRARIMRIRLALNQAFCLECGDRIARGGLSDAQKLAHAADLGRTVIHQHSENADLGRR